MTFENSVKQEVWQTLRALNDAWTKGRAEDLVNYFHEDMVAITATDRNRLEGRNACMASWLAFSRAAKIMTWKEIDPKVQLFENTAIITYYFEMSFEMGGQTIHADGRDMFVFVKQEGKWWAVADQFSPYPA